MDKHNWFGYVIRIVFLIAYASFMYASIHHIAAFFHNFEAEGTDWFGSYALAVSIDGTALVLTIGVMFFRERMPWYALTVTWIFIVFLTAFSWAVNWEYATRYQNSDLTKDPFLLLLNPILASSFAFLNLAYSVVGEFFNTRVETVEELNTKLADLKAKEQVLKDLKQYQEEHKNASVISQIKGIAIEAKEAVKEVVSKPVIAPLNGQISDDNLPVIAPLNGQISDDNLPTNSSVIASLNGQISDDNNADNKPRLGMIEEQIYNAIIARPDLLQELAMMLNFREIAEIVTECQKRFPGYARYITIARVNVVVDALKRNGLLITGEAIIAPVTEQNSESDSDAALFANELLEGQNNDENSDDNFSVSGSLNEQNSEPAIEGKKERNTDELKALNSKKKSTRITIDLTPSGVTVDMSLDRRKPLTIAEAATVLNCAEKTVRRLRNNGQLVTANGDENLVTIASVRRELKKGEKVK